MNGYRKTLYFTRFEGSDLFIADVAAHNQNTSIDSISKDLLVSMETLTPIIETQLATRGAIETNSMTEIVSQDLSHGWPALRTV